ncbi:GNAT family N-acetyltransferase [Clostridium sp. 'White wine YQ']|uniref:GNAT family N-acetyltransferase n=1 Tax=Clostridium sp. 'White wine YQ' TaxID=3027474 RepID=UPI002365182A|nr:GNAT family N-acetyltransferase [Clostridium sp. 'White wine YQ']MDD7793186.1 GNAT family N-acetyltransferase [Clostridium sp. 'White wine YQ']
MIKSYIKLDDREKSLVNTFINRNIEEKKTSKEVDEMFNNKVYDYGNGTLFYFESGKVLGKVNIVLEVANQLGTTYIHFLDIDDTSNNKEMIIKSLIEEAVIIANKYKAKEIYLGERSEERLKLLETLGFHKDYRAIRMYLEDRDKKAECFDLIPLTQENKHEYQGVYNDSFSDMPHGSYVDINGVMECLKKANEENYYFLVAYNNINIGFMDCTIKNGEGTFDIGLCKEYRGRGYGRMLLETAIDFLNKKEVNKIGLLVIERNLVAYNMYKKRGFKVDSIFSSWIKLK